ncbi:SAM-dependent methyltransferase [Elysia marginata]|uniref:SAM-dependent methyltransferase n=1 Tax=Elysia marginata TaxID=1093978 RepID=A0AAV4EEE0_9GAST|nr:SAM-dependent methyltransferase [Elysia marginata]
MQRVWHGDQCEEDQDDAYWKGHKGAYKNIGKRSARAGLEISYMYLGHMITEDVASLKEEADSRSTKSCVADQAEKGFASNGDRYDAHRPGYTDEAVELIAKAITATMGTLDGGAVQYNVLELGAGTGKLTQQLAPKLPKSIAYLATEPSRNFLDTLEAKGLGVDTALASVGSLSLPEGSVETVVCAQCFHWFCDAQSVEIIRRIMAPGGKLIMVWNVNNMEDAWMKPMGEQRFEVISRVGGSFVHVVNTGEWQKAIDASPSFTQESILNIAGNNVVGDLDKILSNIATISAYNMLPEAERKSYLGKLRETIANWPGVDVQNVTMLMNTLLATYVAV